MKKFLLILAVLVFSLASCAAADEPAPIASPAWAAAVGELTGCDQVAYVAYLGDSSGLFSMHERTEDGSWQLIVSAPAVLGRNGLGKTQVGDKKTPQGVFSLDTPFGIKEDPGCALAYHLLTQYDYWSGDQWTLYNRMVDIRDHPSLNTDVSEQLLSMGSCYNYCLNIGYNPECVPEAGAALFLHCLSPGKTDTAGCVAISEEAMITVLQNIREGCVIVIEPFETLTSLPE